MSDHEGLLNTFDALNQYLFDGLGRHIVATGWNEQVLHSANNFPVAILVLFATVAGAEPPIIGECGGGRLWLLPVSREDIGPANLDLVAIAESHLHALEGRSNAAGDDTLRWAVHRDDRRGLGESVDLKHRDSKHLKPALGVFAEGS